MLCEIPLTLCPSFHMVPHRANRGLRSEENVERIQLVIAMAASDTNHSSPFDMAAWSLLRSSFVILPWLYKSAAARIFAEMLPLDRMSLI